MRVWLVGFGTVGRWLARALVEQADRLADRFELAPTVVGVANRRDGFVFAEAGLDPATLLDLAGNGRSIAEHPGVEHWDTAIAGLRATEADLLVEAAASPASDGEPGLAHMREALGRGIPVVTSNKWPVALAGVELAALARSASIEFRAESTVMSGTPLLGPLVDGLAGAVPVGLRGVLNATANSVLTAIAAGRGYEEALAAAQRAGLAEADPGADVEGHDAVAKLMILAALVFDRQLRVEDVTRRGIADVTPKEVDAARSGTGRLRELATLELGAPDGAGEVDARVEPAVLDPSDPLASVEGTTNAVVCRAEPLGELMIAGPGAGPKLAGQGVLSDLIAVGRALRR